jgi:hypothetical protein
VTSRFSRLQAFRHRWKPLYSESLICVLYQHHQHLKLDGSSLLASLSTSSTTSTPQHYNVIRGGPDKLASGEPCIACIRLLWRADAILRKHQRRTMIKNHLPVPSNCVDGGSLNIYLVEYMACNISNVAICQSWGSYVGFSCTILRAASTLSLAKLRPQRVA